MKQGPGRQDVTKIILIVSSCLGLVSCTSALNVEDGRVEELNDRYRVEVNIGREEATNIINNRQILYIGVGDCKKSQADIYNAADINGVSITPGEFSAKDLSGNRITLGSFFDKSSLDRSDCAFLTVTGMNGRGGKSAPIPLSWK